LNSFLRIKKSLLISILIFFILVFLSFLIFNNFWSKKSNIEQIVSNIDVDIINPNFTINNKNRKIFVKANTGNFINKDLILLQNEVYFESKDFKIYSDSVTFNRKEETAISQTKSKFESEGTEIISEGFKIIEQGDIMIFNGKTLVKLIQ